VVTGFVNINMDIDRYLRIVITNNDHTQSQIIEQKSTRRGRGRGRGRPPKKIKLVKM